MQFKPPINPDEIRKYYSKTLSSGIIHLAAHSHRAWHNNMDEAQLQAVKIAHEHVDNKWNVIFGEAIPKFQKLIAERAGIDKPELIANGENTHELVTRLLSSFKWDSSTKVVTTDCEFHSLKRQLYRLKEEGVKIDFVPAVDKNNLTERIVSAVTPETNLVLISTVFFNDGFVLQNIEDVIKKVREVNAVLLLDNYHHFNIRRLNADELGRDIFFTAGGYKYAGAGEGAAWLKVPENCSLRPRITGWFADFGSLEKDQYPFPVKYGNDAQRFLGATRDATGIYRQVASFEFMNELGMSVELLEKNNLHQTEYLIYLYDELKLEKSRIKLISSRNENERGPFLALDMGSASRAHYTYQKLWEENKILTDTRGNILRIGPAPYTTENESVQVMEALINNK